MKKWMMVMSALAIFLFSSGFNPLVTMAKSGTPNQSNVKNPAISSEKAKEIALKQVKGEGEVVKSELDSDDGKQVYDLTVKTSDSVYEVEIDANTGKVLEVEKEDDDNHHDDDRNDDDRYDD